MQRIGGLSKLGVNSITIDASNTGRIELKSATDIIISDFLAGATCRDLYIYTTDNAGLTIDQSMDFSAVASSRFYFYVDGF